MKPIGKNPTTASKSSSPTAKSRTLDSSFSWVTNKFPNLDSWRILAIEYFKTKPGGPRNEDLKSISAFLDRYIIQHRLPTDPELLLRVATTLPEFFGTATPRSKAGAHTNNRIHRFLEFVLAKHLALPDPINGELRVGAKYRNPVPLRHVAAKYTGQIAIKRLPRNTDPTLTWISTDFPELEPWRVLALSWFETIKLPTAGILQSLSLFLDRFLVQKGLPLDPDQLLRVDTVVPDLFETFGGAGKAHVYQNNIIRAFLNFILAERHSSLDPATGKRTLDPRFHNPVPRRNSNTHQIVLDNPKGFTTQTDANFTRVQWKYPQLESWRVLASEWIRGPGSHGGSYGTKLHVLSAFMIRFIVGQGLPLDPATFLSRSVLLPSFFERCCPTTVAGLRFNNYIHHFLNFVLEKKCSELDPFGRTVISSEYRNPVPKISASAVRMRRDETNKSPLPYGYITRLRNKLIEGLTFKEWTWAQNILGVGIGKGGFVGPDWFPVNEEQLDRNDPDCVWRYRPTARGPEILEMWSPVRWVALAFKLLLPLRTFQVRMLDSGEADTWWYESGSWRLNEGPLALGKPGQSRHQGFLHRRVAPDGSITTMCYANTNKTADLGKGGGEMGHVFPWVTFGDPRDDVFLLAEKLRNWQTRYNPISRLTSWTELDGRHMSCGKSDLQLSNYLDTAFLFRAPEYKPGERHLPVTDGAVDVCWFKLLEAFEDDLANAGETQSGGGRIRLLPPSGPKSRRANFKTTNHSLHCLRVSLITALAIDGKVPIEIMQKVVGHSRLLMTIYYVVPGEHHIRLSLEEAVTRLESLAGSSIENFLQNTEFDELLNHAISVDPDGLKAAIPISLGDRNPIGWLPMADGCCLMGGNTSPAEGNTQIGGCFNGGPEVNTKSGKGNGPVPGGPRNCIRCRWFVTMPHYFHALVARLNNLLWEKGKEQTLTSELHQEKVILETEQYDAAQAGVPFDRAHELHVAERRLESSASRLDLIIGNIFACINLIIRCEEGLNNPPDGMGLVTVGNTAEIHARLDGIDSELLQLAQVCEDLEFYPDLPRTSDAIFRRSQILDMALSSEGYLPVFLAMTEEQQKLNGNALIREMARRANPADPIRGRVKVVTLMDLKVALREHLGFDMADCLPPGVACDTKPSRGPNKLKTTGRKNVLHNERSS